MTNVTIPVVELTAGDYLPAIDGVVTDVIRRPGHRTSVIYRIPTYGDGKRLFVSHFRIGERVVIQRNES